MFKEILITLAMVALVGSFWWMSKAVEIPESNTFPHAILWAMLALSCLQLVQALLMGRLGLKHIATVDHPAYRKVLIIVGSMVAYLLALEYIGFYVASFLFYIVTVLILQKRAITARVLLVRGGMAAGFVAALYVLFNVILSSQLPAGILF